jgi:uncharacterized protein
VPNRLANETSPYLRQHQDNPIDWFPWGEEAWAKAEKEDRPVFLSVGYSSCHWCHVMAHESFEDPLVAEALNDEFVSIKLDREERPDVDEVYMTAVQLANGHGGWPMSVFLTPDKKPFFAGTYFPRQPRGEFPGFLALVRSLAHAWRAQRTEIESAAREFTSALTQALGRDVRADGQRLDLALVQSAVEQLHAEFDDEHGGFGGAPKFPPHTAIRFLLDFAEAHPGDEADIALGMAVATLEAIVAGGIHDHVGGGFHRYATDERWHLPHFEKMLSDNALMLSNLARALRTAPSDELRQAADRTVAWLEREMVTGDGLLATALDADSDGEEGAFYVWSLEELGGPSAFTEAFQCSAEGNYLDEATHRRTGKNVLHLRSPGDWTAELDRLLSARDSRPRPGLDDKAVASLNGLAIGGLAQIGALELASRIAARWLELAVPGLPHQVTLGRASGPAFLDDHAYLADGLLDLAEATGSLHWRIGAERLADQMVSLFGDPEGGFFFTPTGEEVLFVRTKPMMDSAVPSPNAVAARVLRRIGRTEDARRVIEAAAGWMLRVPRATEALLGEALHHLDDSGPVLAGGRPQVGLRLEALGEPEADGSALVELVLDLPAGWHVNSHDPPAAWLTPTEIRVEGVLAEAGFPDAPDGRLDGEVRIVLRLVATKPSEYLVRIRYQLCNERECLAPQEASLTGFLSPPSK